jgi:hypothetical protein
VSVLIDPGAAFIVAQYLGVLRRREIEGGIIRHIRLRDEAKVHHVHGHWRPG